MATYYDTASVADLLPSAVTDRDDIALLAAECEASLIGLYTRQVRDDSYAGYRGAVAGTLSSDGERVVHLKYYETDADDVDDSDADEAEFLAAMGRALASLILHRAGQRTEAGEEKGAVVSERRGRRSVTYAEASGSFSFSPFPQGFERHLKAFDLRPAVWC